MVNTTTPVSKVRNTGIVICDDQEAKNKRIAPQVAQCVGKGKAPCCGTGKERLTPSNALQILKERNGGVVIREDRGNGKPPCQANGKENQAPNGSVISNATAAQRARREREKMSNLLLPSKAALAQQTRRQQEKNYSVSKSALAQRKRREREKNEKYDAASCSRTRSEPESENAMETFPEGSVMLPPTPRLVDGIIPDRTPLTSTLQNPQKRRHTENLRSTPAPRNLIDDFADVASPQICVVPDDGSIHSPPPENSNHRVSTPMLCESNTQRPPEVGAVLYPPPRGVIPPYEPGEAETIYPTAADASRHFLGEMNIECSHCGALHWMDEKLSNSSTERPLFGTCCLQGKVRLPPLQTPLETIQALYDGNDAQSRSFRRHTRKYNLLHSFTSLGFTMDSRVIPGGGPIPFTIHGELRHRTGSLLPDSGQQPQYAQLYIYDPNSALEIRSGRYDCLRDDVIEMIQATLLEHNPFPHKFRQAHVILQQQANSNKHLPALLHYSAATDRRRYNLPTTDEIAVILPGDGTEVSAMRDIVLHLNGSNGLMRINECHPAYLPLHYVLLFPRGELGWEPSYREWNVPVNSPSDDRLTQMQYYGYRLFERRCEYSTILRGGRLFQEFLVDAWASTEQNCLTYFRLNQSRLRAELYKDFVDVTIRNGVGPNQVGRQMILPSSHIGGARHMFEIFQDSMAITRFHHHPDIFLTMTANPKWPEVTAALSPHQTSNERPEIVARVFELKRKSLMKELDRMHVFGKRNAHVYTIEFQKCGLPHMHLLIFLNGRDKIRVCSQVDKLVSAEFPDPAQEPQLFETVKGCMVHGPCGARNPNAPCMENGTCTKGYPKSFVELTRMDTDGYALYRRQDTGIKYTVKGKDVDNRAVVPYNPYLSKMFNCHINVEVCAGMRCVKYIHKYIYKGGDRATMILGGADEIQQYLDGRFIGPPEAAWCLLGFSLHEEIPSVYRMALHLPGMHQCTFDPNEPMEQIMERIERQVSTLTGFFAYYRNNPTTTKYTYQEFPQHFVWKSKYWERRQRGFAIGRMYFASPNSGERFYLRLLLTHVKGPSSFESLRLVNGILHPTFKSACVASGLVEDDQEWVQCLNEAAIMKTGYQLRRLFAIILTQCSPVNPLHLWESFSEHICDDLPHKIRTVFSIPTPTTEQVNDYGLYLLNQLLQESGRCLSDYPPMPQPVGNWSSVNGNRLILEHRRLQLSSQNENVDVRIQSLNVAQSSAYSKIYSSVVGDIGTTFFLSGGAGTGKTYLYNTIALKCRSLGHMVVTVASSGIAALLLVGGRTAHSTFCIPLDVHETSVCAFAKQSIHAELFRETTLIIWDEVPMQHKHFVEAVERALRDVKGSNKPFGGITVVLGGDFRQILPVVTQGVREQIVGASLRRSFIWNNINVISLDRNMRLQDTDPVHLSFINFLREIGTNPIEVVSIPSTIYKCKDLRELLNRVYPHLGIAGTITPSFLTDRTILSSKNDDVDAINKMALNIYPGETYTYLAADSLSADEENSSIITNRYPNEYLNSLDPPGLPPFKLELKVGCPVMLLRNLAPNDGLCNGTRLMIVRCASRLLEAQILTGDKAGNLVFIPRISLTPSSKEVPFHMMRRQFPIRLAYSMTINKSQGQSVKFVGIDLRNPVFSHGQLYVALSRCTSPDRISCLLSTNASSTTTNIEYPEVLLQ